MNPGATGFKASPHFAMDRVPGPISKMKNKILPITIALATLAFSGCKPSQEASTAQQFDKVKAETKTAADDMKEYTYAQRAAFVEKMRLQLAALDQDLDQLSAKVEKSDSASKAEASPKLKALRAQSAELNQQLDKAKDATESTWDSVKAGSKKAYDGLKEGFQQARQWTSDKIAP
jgi:hypothetical protein